MNSDCHHLHPHTPPILFSQPPAPSCCLPCELSRVSNTSLIPTLRRSAASNLLMLANSPDQLLRRAAHLAPDLILHLVSTYSTLHPTDDHELCVDLRNSISALSITFDAAMLPAPPSYPYLNLVFVRSCEASLQESEDKAILSASLLCCIIQNVRSTKNLRPSSVLNAVREGLSNQPANFLAALLRLLPSAETLFSHVAQVVSLVLAVVEPSQIDPIAVLQLVERAMPPHRVPQADALFMDVIDELINKTVEVCTNVSEPAWDTNQIAQNVMMSSVFLDSIKSCVLANDLSLRSAATRAISALCAVCQDVAEQMCARNVFDYLVESIRTLIRTDDALPADVKRLLRLSIMSIHAIVEQEPGNLAEKWCYSLDVVMSATQSLADSECAQTLSSILKHPFQCAPAPVFSKDIINQFISFQMTLLTFVRQEASEEAEAHDSLDSSDENCHYTSLCREGMKSISQLLRRFRPCLASMDSIMQFCNAYIQNRVPLLPVVIVLVHLLKRFKDLYELPEAERDMDAFELQNLGQRLRFLVFDSCAHVLEELVQRCDVTMQTGFTPNELLGFLELYTVALDDVFINSNCCTEEDQQRMRAWCWKHLSPRIVFSLATQLENVPSESGSEEHIPEKCLIQHYLLSLAKQDDLQADEHPGLPPTTSGTFLEAIENEIEAESTVWKLFQQSVELNVVDSICGADEIIRVLSRRLHNCCYAAAGNPTAHCLDILRGISFVCTRYGLDFLSLDIPAEVFYKLVRRADFSTSNPLDRNIFRFAVLSENHNEAHVQLWDKVTLCYKVFEQSQENENSSYELLPSNSYQVVKSAVYALERTMFPLELATCLMDIFAKRENTPKFVACCHQSGVSDLLCEIMRKMKRSQQNDMSTESDLNVERERISSILLILTADVSFASSSGDWTLLRETCETFRTESMITPRRPAVWLLLSFIARWLVATVYSQQQQSIASFIYQCGVLESAISLLQVSSDQSFQKDQFLSAASCLVLFFLRTMANTVEHLQHELSSLLSNCTVWELLLNPCSLTTAHDSAYKVTNACYLLLELLNVVSMQRRAYSLIRSRGTSTMLAVSAYSSDKILATAALKVLRKMMTMDIHPFLRVSSSACLLQLSSCLFKRVSSSNMASINEHELMYLASAIACGHFDSELHTLRKSIKRWLQENEVETPSGDKNGNLHSSNCPPSMASAIKELDSRITEHGISPDPLLNLGDLTKKGNIQVHLSEKLHVSELKIVFARHSMLWAC